MIWISRKILFSVSFLLTAFSLLAAQGPSSTRVSPKIAAAQTAGPREVFSPYWTSEPGWDTELQLKNNLASGSLTVTPVLRLASGEEIPLDPVTILPNVSASIWVNEGLLKHSPSLLSQPGSYGSLVLRFTSFNARNLHATAAVSLRGGPIEFHVNAYPPADVAEWQRAAGAGSQEGIWWQPRSGETDVVIVSNSSDKTLAATLWLSDAKGHRWSQTLKLGAHQTERLDVRELVSTSGLGGSYGGIRLEVPAYASALHSVHFTYDEAAKTSAFLKMFSRDPLAKLQERIAATDSRPWTMWSPILPLQEPDPAMGLPASTLLQPTIFVRNATSKPAAASITLNWRGETAKGMAKLKDLNLAAYETRQIQIAPLQKQLGIPDDAHWALVTLSTAGMPDDLMAEAVSYDSTGRYGREAPFSDNLGNWFMGGEWRVDAGRNQLMAVTNGGAHATDALLTLHYDGGGKSKSYEMRQTIKPGEQMWVSVADLIRTRVADRKGNLLPTDLAFGTYDLRDLGPRPGALLISSLAPDSVRGNPAAPPLPTCCGVYSAAFYPALISVLDSGLPFDFTADGVNECTHTQEDLFIDVISWWSGNAAIAKVTPGKVQGMAVGATTANGETDPIYVGMGTNCILKYFYPIAPVTVKPQITSISPNWGKAGTNVGVTISGSGFGTAPTVSFGSTGISVAYVTRNDTTITATFTIAANAPTGIQNVSVTNTTTGDGGSPTSNPVDFQVTPATAVPVNFHLTGASDQGGGVEPLLEANFAWQSSTGNYADLNGCFIRENVTFPSTNNGTGCSGTLNCFFPPSPPWAAKGAGGYPNPTITSPGVNAVGLQNNDYDAVTNLNFVKPYSASSVLRLAAFPILL